MTRGTRRRASHDGCAPENDVAALETDLTNLEVLVFGRLTTVEDDVCTLQKQIAGLLAVTPAFRTALAVQLEALRRIDTS